MSFITNVKKTFDFIMPMISKKIHLKYIESAILDKINICLLFNRMTINGNVMCFLVFLNRYKTIILVHFIIFNIYNDCEISISPTL